MQLSIEDVDGNRFRIEVEPYDTIENVKTKIRDAKGIPTDQQRLKFSDVELEGKRMKMNYLA
jgi:hypothetical protein